MAKVCLMHALSFLFCFANCRWFVITDDIDQASSPWWEGWESWEPWGVVWDIQIIFNFFIVTMLELSVDGAIRCDAERRASATLLNCVDRSFLILLNPNHVDEVAWLWPRSMYKT